MLQVKKLRPDAILPVRAHLTDAGLDFYSCEDVRLEPGVPTQIPTGIAVQIPEGYMGLITIRSGMAFKDRILSAHVGIIDHGYSGEVRALVVSNRNGAYKISAGVRVFQMTLVPIITPAVQEVEEFSGEFDRQGGFGSTGTI